MPAEPKTTVQAAEANALGGSKTYKKNAGKGLLGGLKAQKLLQPRESSTWKSLFKARKPMEGFAALDLPKRYVDLPPSTTFVESCCANEKVSKLVYVPITTSAQSTTGLYAVDLDAPKGSHLKLLATLPIAWLYFGTKLDDNGRLFICEFGPTHGQKGGVVLVDVLKSPNTWTRIATFPDGYQPNDIAIGEDGSLYVACNHMPHDGAILRSTMMNLLKQTGQETSAVFKISADYGPPVVFAEGLRVLAGSTVVPADNALWVSELTQLVRVPLTPKSTRDWKRIKPFDPRMLADNISVVEGSSVIRFPYYRAVTHLEAQAFTNTKAANTAYDILSQPWCKVLNFIEAPPLTAAPDIYEDVHYSLYDVLTGDMVDLKIEIDQEGFDGHVTHVEKLGHDLIFINYTSKQLLVLDAEKAGIDQA